ncbi:alpha/beta hydrolase family protein [Mangrovicoccus ximenensis]|uniref:alpha/beta hydrolase family protein n=1 Tax=Mangrovicoccus ximenensis TaxID=1911570 RepID=UPI001F30F9EA|nr:alpha/beta family hydrolase [Mangrovicoccus ximenensis]
MSLDACADLVRRGDPDRWLSLKGQPAAVRARLMPVYAANIEIARAPWVSSEPAIGHLAAPGPLVIGGKSMGGRVASLVAEEFCRAGRAAGLLCLGYPFHPSGKPERLRTAHLAALSVPALICQGTRDPFGTREEVAGYALSPQVSLHWLEDGDHDLKPRKRITGRSQADHLQDAAAAVAAWAAKTVPGG